MFSGLENPLEHYDRRLTPQEEEEWNCWRLFVSPERADILFQTSVSTEAQFTYTEPPLTELPSSLHVPSAFSHVRLLSLNVTHLSVTIAV